MGWNDLDRARRRIRCLPALPTGTPMYFVPFLRSDAAPRRSATCRPRPSMAATLTARRRAAAIWSACSSTPRKASAAGLAPAREFHRTGHPMILYPAIDLKGGRCVRLAAGRHGQGDGLQRRARRPGARLHTPPASTWLHVVDLDGAFAGALAPMRRRGRVDPRRRAPCRCSSAAACATMRDVEDWLAAAASRVILGTAALQRPRPGASAPRGNTRARSPSASDARDGKVAVERLDRDQPKSTRGRDRRSASPTPAVAALIYHRHRAATARCSGANVEATARAVANAVHDSGDRLGRRRSRCDDLRGACAHPGRADRTAVDPAAARSMTGASTCATGDRARWRRDMMLRRVIPCLDVKDGRVVKGVQLRQPGRRRRSGRSWRGPYDPPGADELLLPRHHRHPRRPRHVARRGARARPKRCFMPLTVGGGVRSVEDVARAVAGRRRQSRRSTPRR